MKRLKMSGVKVLLLLFVIAGAWIATGENASASTYWYVTYNGNGGRVCYYGDSYSSSEIVNSIRMDDYEKSYRQIKYTAERKGYVFKGWALSKDATEAVYKYENYMEPAKINGETITLYAVWELEKYKITYSSNGATGLPEAQSKYYNIPVTLSSVVPTKTGYKFDYWYVSGKVKETYNPGDTCEANENITLLASWSANKYTIIYDLRGGQASTIENQTKTYGSSLKLNTEKPVRECGTFVGWSLNATSKTANYQPGDTFTLNQNATLYAVWDMETYTVTFDDNGGYYGPSYATKVHGTALTMPSVVPEREGYTFLGWATSASATAAQYKVGSSYAIEGDNTLYAVWKKGNSNGGTTASNDGAAAGKQTITAASVTVAYKSKAFNLNAKTDGGGKLTYSSNNKKVATVNANGKITVKGYGKTTITITAAANGTYEKTTKQITITVAPKKVTLKSVKSPKKKYISASWKKDSTATGYQVYFSTKIRVSKDTLIHI